MENDLRNIAVDVDPADASLAEAPNFILEATFNSSAAGQEIRQRVAIARQSDVAVLLQGESGAGKEWTARAIHSGGSRSHGPFVVVRCNGLDEEALERELFGCVRGAVEGCSSDRVGLLEAAHGGTLFLDEVAELPASIQSRLAGVLEERRLRRIGGVQTVPVDFRLISASVRDLRRLVSSGVLRRDLYYRIRVLEIQLPALRHRTEELPSMISLLLSDLARTAGRPAPGVTPEAMDLLVRHLWPGNLRELKNLLERALITSTGPALGREEILRELGSAESAAPRARDGASEERGLIEAALRDTCGNRSQAAMLLGISRITLWKRMRRLGMPTKGREA